MTTYRQTYICIIIMCVQWMHNTLSLVQQAQPQCRTYYSFADTIAMYTKTFSTCPVLVGCSLQDPHTLSTQANLCSAKHREAQ